MCDKQEACLQLFVKIHPFGEFFPRNSWRYSAELSRASIGDILSDEKRRNMMWSLFQFQSVSVLCGRKLRYGLVQKRSKLFVRVVGFGCTVSRLSHSSSVVWHICYKMCGSRRCRVNLHGLLVWQIVNPTHEPGNLQLASIRPPTFAFSESVRCWIGTSSNLARNSCSTATKKRAGILIKYGPLCFECFLLRCWQDLWTEADLSFSGLSSVRTLRIPTGRQSVRVARSVSRRLRGKNVLDRRVFRAEPTAEDLRFLPWRCESSASILSKHNRTTVPRCRNNLAVKNYRSTFSVLFRPLPTPIEQTEFCLWRHAEFSSEWVSKHLQTSDRFRWQYRLLRKNNHLLSRRYRQ